jgi:hypothetical protein
MTLLEAPRGISMVGKMIKRALPLPHQIGGLGS